MDQDTILDLLRRTSLVHEPDLARHGSLTISNHLELEHPLLGNNVPLYLFNDWAVVNVVGQTFKVSSPTPDWSVDADLYPICAQAYEEQHDRFQQRPNEWNDPHTHLFGSLTPISLDLVRDNELPPHSDVITLWTPSLRERVLQRWVVVGGRPFQGRWCRGVQQLLLFYESFALLLHVPHPEYDDVLARWLRWATVDLQVDDEGLQPMPYSYETETMSDAVVVPSSRIQPSIFGLEEHPAADVLESIFTQQFAYRGHVDLQAIDWDELGPPFPRQEDLRRWGAWELDVLDVSSVRETMSTVSYTMEEIF